MAFNIRSRAGWFRLWVLAVVLMGAVTTFFIVSQYPDDKWIQIDHRMQMEKLTPERLARERTLLEKNPYSQPVEKLPPLEEHLTQLRAATQSEYEQALAALPHQRLMHVVVGISAWVTASIGLFVLGWLIGWVIRGFRNSPAN
ncbi:hypothetical protein [Aquipseudomonas alcaligenes]|uniref:Uncharacterized protein n=1 Tax=Aquipseudomonas alcaligenes TaxID=43263 RepID=A0AB73HTS8_AQUAC|nr:hypothetical protein [Pseudomonas alcaligenes]MDH0141139.1 hypothetical protein [Pseudomonas alcaligenes]